MAELLRHRRPQRALSDDCVDAAAALVAAMVLSGCSEDPVDALVQKAHENGLRYLSDSDARPAGGMHPIAHLWDNSADPVQELRHILAVRRHCLGPAGDHC